MHTCRLGCAWVGRNGCPGPGRKGCRGGMKGRVAAEPGWLKWRIPTGPGGWRVGLTGLSLGNTGCCPCWLNAGPGWVNGKGLGVGTGWVLLRSVGGGGGGGGLRCSRKRWLGNLGSPETERWCNITLGLYTTCPPHNSCFTYHLTRNNYKWWADVKVWKESYILQLISRLPHYSFSIEQGLPPLYESLTLQLSTTSNFSIWNDRKCSGTKNWHSLQKSLTGSSIQSKTWMCWGTSPNTTLFWEPAPVFTS